MHIVLLLVSDLRNSCSLFHKYNIYHRLFINRYIGDTIPHVIRSLFPKISQVPVIWIFGDRRLCISFFTLFVSYPLSLYRDISKLAKTSALALIAILVIIVAVAIEGPQQPKDIRGSDENRFNVINDEVFQAIAVISFGKFGSEMYLALSKRTLHYNVAFVCHHNSFLIFGSLKQPSLNRFAKVTHWSMAIAFFTCFALAVSGYWVFTDKTVGNILNNFPSDNTLINVARLAFGLNMFTTIPLEAFVCREVRLWYCENKQMMRCLIIYQLRSWKHSIGRPRLLTRCAIFLLQRFLF